MDKVSAHSQITIQGGFSGSNPPRRNADLDAAADRRPVIERLVARRLLAPGDGFNTFVLRKP